MCNDLSELIADNYAVNYAVIIINRLHITANLTPFNTTVIVDWLSHGNIYGWFQLPRWCASQSQYLKWDNFILQNKTDTD